MTVLDLNSKLQISDSNFRCEILGPLPRKMVKFNPGLSQILSKVFLSKNLLLELTKYFVSLLRDSGMIT